jgi:hypothetical protein
MLLIVGCSNDNHLNEIDSLRVTNTSLIEENKKLTEENLVLLNENNESEELLESKIKKETSLLLRIEEMAEESNQIDFDSMFNTMVNISNNIYQYISSESIIPYYRLESDSDLVVIQEVGNWFDTNIDDGSDLLLVIEVSYIDDALEAIVNAVIFDPNVIDLNLSEEDISGAVMTGQTPYTFVQFYLSKVKDKWTVNEYKNEF